MIPGKPAVSSIMKSSQPLLVDFMPEADCAPIVLAKELRLCKKYGLAMELRRQLNWGSIQDKTTRRQLQGAMRRRRFLS